VSTGIILDTRVHWPWTWPMNTGSVYQALVINILPVVNFDVVSVQE